MEEWAHRKNIERFEANLQSESDPQARRRLEDLLDLERRRLADVLVRKANSEPIEHSRDGGSGRSDLPGA